VLVLEVLPLMLWSLDADRVAGPSEDDRG